MARCELSIHLDGEQTRFRGGDTVTGTVEVRTDTEVPCKGLTVECQWRTRGKGNTARGQAQRLDLFQGTWRPGTVQRQLEIRIPADAPPSFIAADNRLDWTVSLHLDIPRGPDWSGERAILVHP